MKKKVLTMAAIAICASVAATGTLAYYTASDTAHNVITSGGVTIEVVETMKDAEGNITEFPTTPVAGVMPGASVSKIVSVQNTGENDAWVRVHVDTVIHKAPRVSAFNDLLPLEVDGVEMITYDFNTTDWEQIGDYFFYWKPVPPVELDDQGNVIAGVTETLFENVSFAKEMGNDYQNCRIEINVEAEAIQVDNNELADGADITSVWPEFWPTLLDENN